LRNILVGLLILNSWAHLFAVMAALVPALHVFAEDPKKDAGAHKREKRRV
jgi:hypothetical protein